MHCCPKQWKVFIKRPSHTLHKVLRALDKKKCRLVIGLLSDYCTLRLILDIMGCLERAACMQYRQDDESFLCPVLAWHGTEIFGVHGCSYRYQNGLNQDGLGSSITIKALWRIPTGLNMHNRLSSSLNTWGNCNSCTPQLVSIPRCYIMRFQYCFL